MNQQVSPALVEVAAGVHAWIGASGSSNSGVVETSRGPIVIDAQQSEAEGRSLRSVVGAASDKPVRCLINTHFHLDHTAGNVAFDDVSIVAHARTSQQMRTMLGEAPDGAWSVSDPKTKLKLFFGANFDELVSPQDEGFDWFMQRIDAPGCETMPLVAPDVSFADRLEFVMPSDVVHCSYLGPAHCDGDIVVHLPRAGVIFLGDLLFVGKIPWFGDCDLNGWIRCLDEVLKLGIPVVVPGHGPPAGLRDVANFRDLLSDIRGATDRAIIAGLSEAAAVATVKLSQYAALQRYDAWMPFNIRSAYRYLRGERA